MKELIKRIFNDNRFEKIFIDHTNMKNEIEFWGNYSTNETNFYLVVYLKKINENFLIEDVPFYFDAIKKMSEGYDERIDKNLSMVVCINSDLENEDIDRAIFEIEEDPYYFKKYVITYNDNQVNQLLTKFREEESDSNKIINRVVNMATLFSNYKNNVNNKTKDNRGLDFELYEISTKLLIKLPFLKVEKRDEVLENLNSTIEKKLEKVSLLDLKNVLLNIDIENTNNKTEITEYILSKVGDLRG